MAEAVRTANSSERVNLTKSLPLLVLTLAANLTLTEH